MNLHDIYHKVTQILQKSEGYQVSVNTGALGGRFISFWNDKDSHYNINRNSSVHSIYSIEIHNDKMSIELVCKHHKQKDIIKYRKISSKKGMEELVNKFCAFLLKNKSKFDELVINNQGE